MKKLLLTTVLAVVTIVAMANPIGRAAAMQKAQNFMRGINPQAQLQAPATPRKAMGNSNSAPYYIFNAENNKGFVIVSGDDRSEEILGYADEGAIDMNNIPDGLQDLLDGFEDDLKLLDEAGITEPLEKECARGPRKVVANGREPVAPLLTSTWTQGTPYNDQLPTLNNGNHAVTGCVATAIAQVMNYWKYAKMLRATEAYTINMSTPEYQDLNGTVMPSLPITEFNFDLILDQYRTGSPTSAQKAEVAKFMLYVDCAMHAGLAKSTYINPDMVCTYLKTYFNYNGTRLKREECKPYDFERYIYQDISQGLPVWLCGFGRTARHSYVADGYSYDDFFHINWGWDGQCNGYFRLAPMNAYNTSTASSYSNRMVGNFGVYPKDGRIPTKTGEPYKSYIPNADAVADCCGLAFYSNSTSSTKEMTITRGTDGKFNSDAKVEVVLGGYINNGLHDGTSSSYYRTYKNDLAVFDADYNATGQTVGGIIQQTVVAKTTDTKIYFDLKNISLADGTYYFVPRSKNVDPGNEGTIMHIDQTKGDYAYVKAVVTGNQMKLSLVKSFTIDSSEIIGQGVQGYRTMFKVHFTNNMLHKLETTYTLHKDAVNNSPSSENTNLQDVQQLRLQALSSGYVQFGFEPGTEASKLIVACYDYDSTHKKQVYTYNYTPKTSSATTPSLSYSWNMNNADGTTIYGNELKGTLTITNTGNSTYEDVLTLYVDLGYSDYGGSKVNKYASVVEPVRIEKGKSHVFNVGDLNYSDSFDQFGEGVTPGSCTFKIKKGNGSQIKSQAFTFKKGLCWWDQKGILHAQASSNTDSFTVPTNAVAVSIQGAATPRSITANNNSNTIYYVDSDSEVTLVKNGGAKNVVQGTTAVTDINFNDNYAAFVPKAFTAAKVSYTRQFTNGFEDDEATRGWSTICLPFNVQRITNTAQDVDIDFFRYEGDQGKNFWLRQYHGHEFRTLYFDYPTAFEANVPYIISMPGQTYQTEGDEWCLTNKNIVFSAENVDVEKTLAIVDCDNYDFLSTTTARKYNEKKSLFTMEGKGNYFTYQNGTVENYSSFMPFRAYLTSENVPVANTENLVKVAQLAPMDRYEAREIINHRFPAVQFTYNGLTYEVPAWDEVVESGAVNTRLQSLHAIKTGETNVPVRTVTNRAWSIDSSEPVFESFEGGSADVTVGNASKSVSTLTYGEAADLLGLSVAAADRSVKVFDFASAATTAVTVPGQYNVTQGVNAGHTFVVNEIGAGTYCCNSTLTEINIPATVTSVKAAAFSGCTALNKVTFENAEPVAVEGDPFAGVTKNKCAIYVPSNIVKAYRESNELWNDFIFAVPVVTAKKFVSFCSDVPFTTRQFNGQKWVAPTTIWMYWIDKAKNNSTSITMTATRDFETKVIPAGFGLVIKTTDQGASGYIFMPLIGANEKSDLIADNNRMKGVTVKTQMGDIVSANPDNYYYILTDNKFRRVTSGNLEAGLAYLEMPKSIMNGSAKISISLEDDVTDGIILINGDEQNASNIYDIQGRKVENATKGIYIVNGKKVVIK